MSNVSMVSVFFDPLKRYATINADGDHISPYSDLAGCENKDLHICGKRLVQLLDEELGCEYQLEIKGSQFQIDLMNALAKGSSLCTAVHGTVSDFPFSMDEIVDFAAMLNNKYHYGIDSDTHVQIGGDLAGQIQSSSVVLGETSEVYVVSRVPDAVEKGKTVLLASDHFDIRNTRGINIVEVPDTHLNSFIEYYRCFTKIIPFIDAVFSESRYASLTKPEKLLIEAYTTQMPRYVFEVAKTALDVGESADFQFVVLPKSASDMFRLSVDRPDAIAINGSTLSAVKEGIVSVSVVDSSGEICESKQLSISSHSYVNSIRLFPSNLTLEIGKQSRIAAYILPENAEDANNLNWNSSNPDVVHVTSAGEVIALKRGSATITVSSTVCSEQAQITVCPPLEKISLSRNELTVQVGASETVVCNLQPDDAAHGEIIWELSNDGMGTLDVSNDGKTCRFTAVTSSIVKGSLKCRIKGTEKEATCAITVMPEQKPIGLLTCTIVISAFGVLGSFLIPMIWFGGGGIGGFFADIFLPIGIILSLIGKSKEENTEKLFQMMLVVDIAVTIVMFLFAIICCSPK